MASDLNAEVEISVRVVGIGASAGGLDALNKVLQQLPSDSGMAFVVIQHLDPTQPSHLAERLSRATTMVVTTALDGAVLKPNHVYTAPAHVYVEVINGHLRLTPHNPADLSQFKPIDTLFLSLASYLHDLAIGIVLSGSGTDGKAGLAAIKFEGGVTFAQLPSTAAFPAMPEAAIELGVDFILAPELMAKELVALAKSDDGWQSAAQLGSVPAEEPALSSVDPVVTWLRSAKGTDFMRYKRPTIERRIRRRMGFLKITKPELYVRYLSEHPLEVESLYEDILIKVTSFFRDIDTFDALRKEVLPEIIKKKGLEAAIRIWVAGCATGEEAYSIAICLAEAFEELAIKRPVRIFATDISLQAIAIARAGVYSVDAVKNISAERLARFFVPVDGSYQISKSIREMCVFAQHDVAKDPPFSRLDLISCRNLVIYFGRELQRRVLGTFHFSLEPKGFLFLGGAETVGLSSDLFDAYGKTGKIFARRATRSAAPDFSAEHLSVKHLHQVQMSQIQLPAFEDGVKADAGRAIISKWNLNGVVISHDMEILQFLGQTSDYLTHKPGELASCNLLKLAPTDWLIDLRLAIHEAAATGLAARRDDLMFKAPDGVSKSVNIEVIPFETSVSAQPCFVVLFRDQRPGSSGTSSVGAGHLDDATDARFSHLLNELAETKAYLNNLLEKEQAAHEQLKSASEELLSSNEEMLSTNQELQTAKEEAQAANEELQTLNEELRRRHLELSQVYDDLANTLSSGQVALIMISNDLKCRMLTPAAEKILKLQYSAVGLPLSRLMSQFNRPELEGVVRDVIEALHSCELEIFDSNQRYYDLRIRPYLTGTKMVNGAVLVLGDISSQKRTIKCLENAQVHITDLLNSVPVSLLVLDEDLRAVMANQCFLDKFKISSGQVKHALIYDLADGVFNAPELRLLLESTLPQQCQVDQFVMERQIPSLGRRVLKVNARYLIKHDDNPATILLAIVDMTDAGSVY